MFKRNSKVNCDKKMEGVYYIVNPGTIDNFIRSL
jgi:hypothetical protein